MDIYNFSVDAFRKKLVFCSFQNFRCLKTGDKDRKIFALFKQVSLKEVELIAFFKYLRTLFAEKTYIDNAVVIVDNGQSCSELYLVDRFKNNHAGNRTHDADIFHAHMGGSVELCRDAGVCSDYLDIVFRIGNRDGDLIADASGSKRSEALYVRFEAVACKPCSDRGHILFRDSAVEHLVREALIQIPCAACFRKVCVKDNYMTVFCHKLGHDFGICFSHFHISVPPYLCYSSCSLFFSNICIVVAGSQVFDPFDAAAFLCIQNDHCRLSAAPI